MDNYDYVYMGGGELDQQAAARDEQRFRGLMEELRAARRTSANWKELAKTYREMASLAVDPGRLFAGMIGSALREPDRKPDVLGRCAVEILAWAFQDLLFQHPEGKNYIECSLHPSDGGPDIYVTIQRPGGKTPHQMRMEAERARDLAQSHAEAWKGDWQVATAEIEKLRAELEGLKAQGPCRS